MSRALQLCADAAARGRGVTDGVGDVEKVVSGSATRTLSTATRVKPRFESSSLSTASSSSSDMNAPAASALGSATANSTSKCGADGSTRARTCEVEC
eukprot:3940844-Rhodomonas_salina.12